MKTRSRYENIFLALLLIILAGMVTTLNSGCQSQDWVARVNGKVIDKEAFDRRLKEVSARYPGQVPDEKDGARYDAFRGTVAEDMVVRELFRGQASKLGIKVSENEVEQGLQEVIKQKFAGDKKKFYKALKREGISLQRARGQMAEGMLIMSLKKRITNAVAEPTDEEARLAYEKNPKKYELASAVKLRHILLGSEAEAKKVLAKLRQGEDMAKLAAAYSKDALSKNKGGEVGWVQRGSSEPEIEEAAFSLLPGAYSEPVKTKFGWHIIKVEDTRPSYQRTFMEAKSTIKKELLEQAREQYWLKWLEKIKKEADIKYRKGYEPLEDIQHED